MSRFKPGDRVNYQGDDSEATGTIVGYHEYAGSHYLVVWDDDHRQGEPLRQAERTVEHQDDLALSTVPARLDQHGNCIPCEQARTHPTEPTCMCDGCEVGMREESA